MLRVYAGRDPLTGRKMWKARSFRGSKRDAERALAAFVTEMSPGRPTGPSRTFGELLDSWFDARSGDWSPSTAQQTRWIVNGQLRGLADRKVADSEARRESPRPSSRSPSRRTVARSERSRCLRRPRCSWPICGRSMLPGRLHAASHCRWTASCSPPMWTALDPSAPRRGPAVSHGSEPRSVCQPFVFTTCATSSPPRSWHPAPIWLRSPAAWVMAAAARPPWLSTATSYGAPR